MLYLLFILVTVTVLLDKRNLLTVFIAVWFQGYSLIPIWSRNNLKYAEEHFSLHENKTSMPDSLKS